MSSEFFFIWILLFVQMDDILIPMVNGNLNDIDQSVDDQNDSIANNNTAVLARESL